MTKKIMGGWVLFHKKQQKPWPRYFVEYLDELPPEIRRLAKTPDFDVIYAELHYEIKEKK